MERLRGRGRRVGRWWVDADEQYGRLPMGINYLPFQTPPSSGTESRPLWSLEELMWLEKIPHTNIASLLSCYLPQKRSLSYNWTTNGRWYHFSCLHDSSRDQCLTDQRFLVFTTRDKSVDRTHAVFKWRCLTGLNLSNITKHSAGKCRWFSHNDILIAKYSCRRDNQINVNLSPITEVSKWCLSDYSHSVFF